MDTLQETIQKALDKIIDVKVGKSFKQEDSLRVLGAVQIVNKKYGSDYKTPLFIRENRVMFSESFFIKK